jgi:hypothetical protein
MDRIVIHNGKSVQISIISLSDLNLHREPPLIKLSDNKYLPPHKREVRPRHLIQQYPR